MSKYACVRDCQYRIGKYPHFFKKGDVVELEDADDMPRHLERIDAPKPKPKPEPVKAEESGSTSKRDKKERSGS